MHDASVPLVIIHRVVLGTAIIPEGERAFSPAKKSNGVRLRISTFLFFCFLRAYKSS
jgi:hypothetical protein